MNITIIQPRVSYYIGGSEKVALKHAEILSKIKDNFVTLYTIKPVYKKYSPFFIQLKNSNSNVKIIELKVPEKYLYIFNEEPELNQSRWDREAILFSLLVHDKIKKNKTDIILSYYIVDAVFRNLDIPNIVYLGGHPPKEIEIYNAFLSFCDATISNSINVQNMWIDKINKNNISLNYVISKGAEISTTYNNMFDKNIPNIVFAGRLIRGKGVDTLIESFKKIVSYNSDAKLWILGDGPEKNNLKKQVTDLKLIDSVTFCGNVENVQDYFKSATVCVFPSTRMEGLMTVVIEAMAVGSCVISSKGIGNEELIENGENGILIESNNSDLLFQTIKMLISNPEKIKKIGHEAALYIRNNNSWEKVSEQLNKILKDVAHSFIF